MTNFEHNISNAGREYSLTDAERAKMSRTIRSYMMMKPLRSHEGVTTSVSWFIYLHRPIAAALILVLVTSTGVSYAAENALPGDALYAIKTHVNEPMKVALATSAEAKADAHIEIAERRIEEAASLAAEGRLDQETGSELAAAFESSAHAAHESITEAQSEDEGASLELTTRFENRLAAHEAVLAEVVATNESDVDETGVIANAIHLASLAIIDTTDTSAPTAAALMVATNVASDSAPADEPVATTMAMSIAAKAPEARTMKSQEDAQPEATETARAAVATEPIPAPSEKAVTRIQASADKRLKAAQKALAQSGALSDDVRANFEADLSIAANMLNTGNDQFKNDARADALASFQSSLQISEQTLVRIKAAPTLEKARSRAREVHSSNTSRKNSDRHRVEISAPTVSATVTAPISVPINVKVDTHEDSHSEDEHAGEDNSGNASSPKVDVKGSLKLDLTL